VKRFAAKTPLASLFRNMVVLLLIAYFISLFFIWRFNLSDTESTLRHISSTLAQAVKTTLNGHDLILQGLGKELVETGALRRPEYGRELIERMKNIDPGMAGFGLARPDGQLILVSGLNASRDLPNLMQRKESRESFKKAIEKRHLQTGRPYFFEALGNWVVPIRTPIRDQDERLVAVMTAGYMLKNATTAWSEADLPEGVKTVLLGSDGFPVFMQPLPADDSQEALAQVLGEQVAPEHLKRFAADYVGGRFSSNEQIKGLSETPHYLSYDFIPNYEMHVVALIDQKTVFIHWLKRTIAPTVLLMMFLLGGGWTFYKTSQRQENDERKISQLSAWQEAVLDGANYSVVSTDIDGVIVSFNRAAEKLLGYKEEELVGKETPGIFHDKTEIIERAEELSKQLEEKIEPGFDVFTKLPMLYQVEEREWTYIKKDGSRFPVYLSVTPLKADDGNVVGFLGIAVDLSEKKAILANLTDSENRYHTLFDNAGDAIFLLRENHFVECNPATLKIFGCHKDQIINSTPERFSPKFQPDGSLSRDKALEKINAALEGKPQFFEWQHIKCDGSVFAAEVTLNKVVIADQLHLLVAVRDITERKEIERQLEYQAKHDSLTNLPNRFMLHEAFPRFVAQANAGNKCVALLLFDLDRFKEINDTLGHHVGDKVLENIGPKLLGNAHHPDVMLARLGGDEFAMLFVCKEDMEKLSQVANRYAEIIKEPMLVSGMKISSGASFGIACYPQHASDSHDLLRAADVAMYQAKKLSLGVVIYDRKIDGYTTKRLALANDLKLAVEENQLVLHYQPKINVVTGSISGFEALVRWQHPSRGLLYPDAFIDIVEMSEIIHSFTQAVINIAVQQKKQLSEIGFKQPVSINLSARNLLDDSCFNSLVESLHANQLDPCEVEIELTESAVMHDPANAINILNLFHEYGVKISVDDFGTGYSSLAYLRQLPVYALKIDRTFVMDMVSVEQDKAIVASTIALAHSLDLKVIAEGVEDDRIMKLLSELNCDYAQGYGISRPLTSDSLLQWIEQYH
jgi:diguanylate cyclase (GGDEF)-like protein/PAS domain S-box-containing protein